MAEYIVMPKLGFDMREGVLNNWLKQVGDTVNRGEVVAEIESDKATLELEAQVAGVLLQTLHGPGDIVPVGANLAIVGQAGEDVSGIAGGNGGAAVPEPDNDGDGVLDAADTCPDKMETKNGYQDGDGCPDEVPAALAKFTGVIKGINFKTGSAEILKTSNKILDKAVKVMQDYPDIKLEIQGHTDDVGDDAANLELSQKRAESVKAYFEAKGVPADRVTAKGYGETAPSAPIDGLKGGKLKAAQAKNRRVEFKLLSDLQQ